MAMTPETLPRHELVGLDVEVADATDPSTVGIAGTVVAETTRTLAIEGADRVWHVPKAGTTFEFALPAAGTVSVAGDGLVARPARRTEATGDSKWR
jgi:ribonuclease P protein subunit POP4